MFVSIVHDDERILNKYFDAFYESIKTISDLKKNKKIKDKFLVKIRNNSAHSTFKRLN